MKIITTPILDATYSATVAATDDAIRTMTHAAIYGENDVASLAISEAICEAIHDAIYVETSDATYRALR